MKLSTKELEFIEHSEDVMECNNITVNELSREVYCSGKYAGMCDGYKTGLVASALALLGGWVFCEIFDLFKK